MTKRTVLWAGLMLGGMSLLAASAVLLATPSPSARAGGSGHVQPALAESPVDVYDPLRRAYDTLGQIENLEASVPSLCYTKTDGASNPCWVCHTVGAAPNARSDQQLQAEYAFSPFALVNRWTNLFVDRSAEVDRISDAEILAYVRGDNYSALRPALLASDADYAGYVPDLDFDRGFDDEGFARDGSAWRALRYAPFPGTFWPTNGSTDDVFIRLPEDLRQTREEYKANLALLETALGSDPRVPDGSVRREIEPIDERVIRLDLDRNGKLEARTSRLVGLPARYVGNTSLRVLRNVYPPGTEFLHSVRYLDPDAPTLLAKRMKELRYMKKVRDLDAAALREIYRQEDEEKAEGEIPSFAGSAPEGLMTFLGWRLQGFIEDPAGRLRLQTDEEHRFCMGCHSGLGVTVDGTFAFPRKVPGAAGYRYQDLRGQHDRPQVGHEKPEILSYLERARGGDELRANAEMLTRFVPDGRVNQREVRRAAAGGDRDLAWLLGPSRERALALDKAYLALVRRDAFQQGRDPSVRPLASVHRAVENGPTAIGKSGRIYADGRLQLAWTEPARGRTRD